jgi:hypothetical protein
MHTECYSIVAAVGLSFILLIVLILVFCCAMQPTAHHQFKHGSRFPRLGVEQERRSKSL